MSSIDGRWGPVALIVDTAEFAGAELYLVTLVEHLNDRVRFVALVGQDAAEETRERLFRAGAEIRDVEGLKQRPYPRGIRLLARELRHLRPLLAHANLAYQRDGLGALGALLFTDVPMVATLHLVVPGRTGWRERFAGWSLRRFRCVIGVSQAVVTYLEERGVAATLVLNGLPPTQTHPEPRKELGLEEAGFVVGGVGRLHEQKGWDVLCRAAALVRRERPETVFAVVGDGPEREALRALPECAHVSFLGYRSRAAALIPAFDVLAVPSRYEGLGLVPMEALFQGVPVVASSVEGLGEVLGDCAVLVPPDDPKALAAGILRIANDAELRAELGRRGRERAGLLFSAERMADETFEAYRAAAGERAAAASTVEEA